MTRLTNQPLASTVSADLDFGVLGPGAHDSTEAGLTVRPWRQSSPVARGEHDYRPRLPTAELIAEVRELLANGRRTERLLCRYLADLADRVQARRDADLGPYADELEAARSFFGLGARETRERVRIGRALRQLPQIETALVDGQLSYSRVREVTRVATAQTELDWLELASRLDMRALEQRVTASRAAVGITCKQQGDLGRATCPEAAGQPVCVPRRHPPGGQRVTFELSSGAWELLERAMQAARRACTAELSDGEALEVVARLALSVEGEAGASASEGSETTEDSSRAVNDQDRDPGAREPRTETTPNELDRLGLDPAATQSGVTVGVDPGLGPPAAQSGATVDHDLGLDPAATPSGATVVLDPGIGPPATQSGAAVELGPAANPDSVQCDAASQLLSVMHRRQRWSLDALTEATGLLAKEVSVAMLLLELNGSVRWSNSAYEPI